MKKHLKLNPHKIDENSWWYEDNGGVDVVVHKDHPAFTAQGSAVVRIKWKQIRDALKRKDKK